MGNTCNLACAICGSHSSSKWGSIDKSFGIEYKPIINGKTKIDFGKI